MPAAKTSPNGTTDKPDVRAILTEQLTAMEASIAPMREQIAGTEEEIRRVQAALRALDGDFTRTPQPSRPRPASTGGSTGSRAPRGQNKALILKAVSERPGVSAGEVANVAGLDNAVVATSLSKLASDGDVERTKTGRNVAFKLTEQGKATLAGLADKLPA